jgi:hypothetical protein
MVVCVGLWCAACGGGGGGAPDEKADAAVDAVPADDTVDGGADAAPADASVDATARGIARVKVLADEPGDLIAQIPVLFSRQDGELIAVEMTDDAGEAAYEIPRDVSVTMVHPWPQKGTVTITGVQPGATVRFGAPSPPLRIIARMNVSWPETGIADTFYDVETPCGGFGEFRYERTSGELEIDERCAGKTFDVTVIALRKGVIRSYLTRTQQTAVDGGTLALDGAYADVPVLTPTYTMPVGARFNDHLVATYDGRRYVNAQAFMPTSTDGKGTLTYALPPVPGSLLVNTTNVHLDSGETQVIGRRFASTDQLGFDVTAALAANVTSAAFNPSTRVLTWEPAIRSAPDVAYASLDDQDSRRVWRVVAAGDAPAVTLPRLPAPLAEYDVTPDHYIVCTLVMMHLGIAYPRLVDGLGTWVARNGVWFGGGAIDWLGAPRELTSYTATITGFSAQTPPAPPFRH